MTTPSISTGQTIATSLCATPFICAGSAFFGYVYGKLADLPAAQIAKAYAVWTAVSVILSTFTLAITNPSARAFAQISINIASSAIGISEMRKRGLMGDKLMYFSIAVTVLGVLRRLSSCGKNPEPQIP